MDPVADKLMTIGGYIAILTTITDDRVFFMIFADPPYALPQLESIPDCVMGHGLLRPDGLFVLEHGKTNDFSSHPCFVEERTYGSVHFSFFQEKE